MLELHAQDRGLDFVQTAVPAGFITYIFSSLTLIEQGAQTCFEFFGVSYDHARIAVCAEILRWIEADARNIAERTRPPGFVSRADGLRIVFNDQKTFRPRKREARIDVRGETIQMHTYNRAGTRRYTPFNFAWVDIVGVGPNIREHRFGAKGAHSTGSGNKCKRRQNHLVARIDPAGAEGEDERVRARGDADAVRHAAVGGNFAFQRSSFTPQDELLRGDDPLDRGANLCADGRVLRSQIELGHRFKSRSCLWIRGHSRSAASTEAPISWAVLCKRRLHCCN